MSNNKPEIKIKGKIQDMNKKKTLSQNNLIFY